MQINIRSLYWFGLAVLVGVMVLFTVLGADSFAEAQKQRLATYLNEQKATADQKEAYYYALEHPEVLKYLPCYCGCGQQGHKSNYHCFLRESPGSAKVVFDNHGLYCPMCVQIALYARDEMKKGKTVAQIRQEIDDAFKQHPKLKSTPTPLPKS